VSCANVVDAAKTSIKPKTVATRRIILRISISRKLATDLIQQRSSVNQEFWDCTHLCDVLASRRRALGASA